MENLGVIDQLFYKADQYQVASMIMGGVSILAPARPNDPLDAQAIAGHLAARLGNIPLLRQKLVQDPLRIGSVRKVDDPDFDVWAHIDVAQLPAPGGYRELADAVATLSAQPLSLQQLWRWTILAGLKDGKLAIVCKIHHALADGVGVVEVLSSMYDPKPVRPEKWRTKPLRVADPPSPYALLGDAIAQSTRRICRDTPRFIYRNTRPLLAALGSSVKAQLASRGDVEREPLFPRVESTSLNISGYSNKRSVAWQTFSLVEMKTIARHFGCTINDIGLLLYSFAMQSYFAGIGEAIDFDLWCGVPINTRSNTPGKAVGNQVSAGRVCLHTTLSDPLLRLQAISADTRETKKAARPEKPLVDMEEIGALLPPVAIDGLLYLAGRFNFLGKYGGKYAVMHTLLSNVPGPPTTVYVANGAMVESIPLIPAIDVIAVSGGIVSVDKAITIGFHCDGETVQKPELFVKGVNRGMRALRAELRRSSTPKRKARAGAKKTKARS